MSNTAVIVILCAAVFESLIIIISNIFTVFVFWKHRNKLKRTSLLLINLAVADLLVGLTELISIATYELPEQVDEHRFNSTVYGHIASALRTLFSFASVFFLVLISLECAYALIWPLRHRVVSSKVYTYSVIFVWVAGISTGTLSFLAIHGLMVKVNWIVATCVIAILCVTVICVSYLAIRKRLNRRVPALDGARRNTQTEAEPNSKLSRTLFIVIAASILFWFPCMVIYAIYSLCSKCFPSFVIHIFSMFRLTNSVVNPIIYSFRIPVFKETLKRLKLCKQSKQYSVNYRP